MSQFIFRMLLGTSDFEKGSFDDVTISLVGEEAIDESFDELIFYASYTAKPRFQTDRRRGHKE